MKFDTVVTLGDGDSFAYTADQAAAQVLAALGGNPTTDYATVRVNQASQGSHGTPPSSPLPGDPGYGASTASADE
jgi:hypothetical protein